MARMGEEGFTCVSLSVMTAAAREQGQNLCSQLEEVLQRGGRRVFSNQIIFFYSSSFKNREISTIYQYGDLREINLSFLLLLAYSAISGKSCNSSVPLFIFVR